MNRRARILECNRETVFIQKDNSLILNYYNCKIREKQFQVM